MSQSVRIVMAQIDPKVGDIAGNVQIILNTIDKAKAQYQADLIVFPEMTITGYPPEDLLLREGLYPQVNAALDTIAKACADVACVIGYPMMDELGERFNMAAWIEDGVLQASYFKQHLPNYSVFDEQRYFSAGKQSCVVEFKGVKFGILICEDIWKVTPAMDAVEAGAEVLLTLNASPFSSEKHQDRVETLRRRVNESHRPVIYVNQVGGQDELVFDGGSFAMDAGGELCAQSPEFVTDLKTVEVLKQGESVVLLPSNKAQLYANEARIYEALKLGLRDYVQKNGFPGVLLGLSGGIDSALTLAIAVDALGADKVQAVMMPYDYTAEISKEDAAQQAQIMGVAFESVSIAPMVEAFASSLNPVIGCVEGLTEENLQARVRGSLLMAMSNATGKMVVATSNKSEVAVGYSTLYGDMVGGFSPLKDVPKTLVYRLANYRNSLSPVIPERVITRAPSAELRPDQKDQDSLPDYNSLDVMIDMYVASDQSAEEISAATGQEYEEVRRVLRMIDRSEYKRRQSAPGVKITNRAFGRDRRYPITSGYWEK